jgi:ComEC/Rec2-related protein
MVPNVLSHRFRRTSLIFLLCVAFVVGIGLAKTGKMIDSSWWWLCLAPVLLTWRNRKWWTVLWIVLLGLSLGWWRGSLYMTKLAAYDQYFGHKVTITAVANQDAAYNAYKQLVFDAHDVVVTDTGEHLKGKISVGGFGFNGAFAGDEVTATGTLKPSLGSYQGRMTYSQVTVTAHHPTAITEVRRRFTSGMQSALPEPLASFGMGLLIGQRNNLPPEISQDLLMVGLTHIIAVSGYNLTILLRSSNKVVGKRSKRQGTLLSLALIGVFLLFAGTSASIVRAAIVSLLSIAAGYYGRSFKPLTLISLAAAITAFANPFYVWSDSGWALSFLAFYGVMVLSPLITHNWPERFRENIVIAVAMESICAELLAVPYVLHTFGQISFIGLAGNVLIAALVPLAMLLSMIAGLAGMLVPAIAGWFAWPAQILLTYMLDMAHLLSRVPHVFAQNLSFSWLELIIWYVVIAALTTILWFKRKQQKGIITDINIAKHTGVESPHVWSQQMVNN